MTTPGNKFRARIENLIKNLRPVLTGIEQIKELEKFSLTFDLGMRANPLGTIGLFMQYLKPHADEILTGNEDYFLTTSIADTGDANLLLKLRSWWPELPEESREDIKKTLKLLIMLGTLSVKDSHLLAIINTYREADNPLTF